jgi:predicted RNA-binding Zn-ribbon protein involved in translation (DUF1610 family)
MAPTTTARGTCPVCGTSRTLRRDGTVREHWHDYHRCHGSGWAPEPSDPSATTSPTR